MKICFVHEEYPDETNFGGIATYQKIMAEYLASRGNTVYVIARSLRRDSEEIINGVHITRIFVDNYETKNGAKKYRQKICDILRQMQSEEKIDIIETPDWSASTVYFEKFRKVPLVVRLHTPLKIWLKYNNNEFGVLKNQMLKWENQMLKKADVLTSCSSILKKMVISEYDISNKIINVIPNPANIVDFYCDNKIKKANNLLFVGSLEERKGVVVLAKALNLVFKERPNINIIFIGKDTVRNHKNISTKKLILDIVKKEYHDKITFLGQIANKDLNRYFNEARVAIFPSLFDNFPYVVLEAMATGIEIVGSKNSGMVDMLNNYDEIYDTGSYEDLAKKIIIQYDNSLKHPVNMKNIKRVNELYNCDLICNKMLEIYNKAIDNYNFKKTLEKVLYNITSENKINKFAREKKGVSNNVYKVITTTKETYIIKRYSHNYDFSISNALYKKYIENDINIISPINSKIITINSYNYNVFRYIKSNKINNIIDINYICKLLNCNRKIESKSLLKEKCLKYYNYLKKDNTSKKLNKEIDYVLGVFERLKDNALLNEKYLNHGDISKSNILQSKCKSYIIDFDEATVSSFLYDFAVSIIKLYTFNNRIKTKEYLYIRNYIKKCHPQYKDNDFYEMVEIYLCKILLEKFYLYRKGEINLFSKRQLKDNYKKYLKILINFEKRCDLYE